MAIPFYCKCGQRIVVSDDHAGRVVRCRRCRAEQKVPESRIPPLSDAWPEDSPVQSTSPSVYVYKMVQIPPVIDVGRGETKGQEAASYLQRVVNAHARQGWEFFRTDAIGVRETHSPGCLGVFFGATVTTTTVQYCVITFRRPADPAAEAASAPVEAVRDETQVRQLEHRRARLAEEAKRQSSGKAEPDVRPTNRDDAYRAKGTDPGPMAWLKAMPAPAQTLLVGAWIALPLVIGIVVMFRAMSPAVGP